MLKNYIYIFLAALLVRLINLLIIDNPVSHALMEDALIYWEGAQSWKESGYFSRNINGIFIPETERVPAYFILLLFLRDFFNDGLVAILFCQAVIDSLTCVIIYKLGSMINIQTAKFSALFSIFSFNMILHSSFILTETLFLFFMCCLLLFAADLITKFTWKSVIGLGIFCGLAIMTRSLVFLIPISITILGPITTYIQSKNWIRGFKAGLVVLVISGVITSPILYRNWTNYNTLHLTSQNGVFFLDWGIGIIKSLETGKPFSEIGKELNKSIEKEIKKTYAETDQLNPFELSEIRLNIANNKFSELSTYSILHGFIYGATNNLLSPTIAIDPRVRSLNTSSFYNTHGHTIIEKVMNFVSNNNNWYLVFLTIGFITSILFAFLQALGFILIFRSNQLLGILIIFYIMYFLIICGPVGSPKYRIPIEPALIILQSYAGAWMYIRQKKLKKNHFLK